MEEREAKLEETRVEIEERGRQLEASVVEMTNQLKQAQEELRRLLPEQVDLTDRKSVV